ncbi:MAG: hypothetical protein SCARUB_05264 [Candidatus Scalindua rubra]|uniref:Virulence protein n=1 Tax=Candidatus Scalindua rubra TaxID=1872076 RepID=A0A1E3X231_9BACT|nr:MAG: hypothetical protein SCARUB_05264 [Candidatus Scalindua rubra]
MNEFLKTSGKKLLTDPGKTSHQEAIEKANLEYDKFRAAEDKKYISDFDREMKRIIGKEDAVPKDDNE